MIAGARHIPSSPAPAPAPAAFPMPRVPSTTLPREFVKHWECPKCYKVKAYPSRRSCLFVSTSHALQNYLTDDIWLLGEILLSLRVGLRVWPEKQLVHYTQNYSHEFKWIIIEMSTKSFLFIHLISISHMVRGRRKACTECNRVRGTGNVESAQIWQQRSHRWDRKFNDDQSNKILELPSDTNKIVVEVRKALQIRPSKGESQTPLSTLTGSLQSYRFYRLYLGLLCYFIFTGFVIVCLYRGGNTQVHSIGISRQVQ